MLRLWRETLTSSRNPRLQIKYPVPSAFLRAKFVSCEEFTGSRNQHRREPCDSLVDCFGGGGVCLRDPRDRAASHIFDRSRTVVRLALYLRGHCACYFWHSFGERYFGLAYIHRRVVRAGCNQSSSESATRGGPSRLGDWR